MAPRLPVVVAGAAIVAIGAFTAGCGGAEEKAPTTTPTTTTTTTTTTTPPPAPPPPTEKSINPTGGNLFTPTPIPVLPEPSQNPHRRGGP